MPQSRKNISFGQQTAIDRRGDRYVYAALNSERTPGGVIGDAFLPGLQQQQLVVHAGSH